MRAGLARGHASDAHQHHFYRRATIQAASNTREAGSNSKMYYSHHEKYQWGRDRHLEDYSSAHVSQIFFKFGIGEIHRIVPCSNSNFWRWITSPELYAQWPLEVEAFFEKLSVFDTLAESRS